MTQKKPKPYTDFFADQPTVLEQFPEHARLIGLIVSEWSNLEFKLVWLASMLIGVHHLVLYSMVYANGVSPESS